MLLLSKWSKSSLMWYLYITDENGDRFNLLTATATSQNEVIYLWCNYRFSSHWTKDGTGPLMHSKGSLLRNEVIPLACDIFTSLMRKVTDLFLLQEESPIWRVTHQTRLLLAKMKWFICDVIPDSHLIALIWNRSSNTLNGSFYEN